MNGARLETVLAEAYAHGPGKLMHVPRRAVSHATEPPPEPTSLRELVAVPQIGERLLWTIRTALAPRRWEPGSLHNDHRAYPSPRSLFLVDVWLRCGERRVLIDPVRGVLHRRVRPSGVDGIALELWPVSERMPDGYGPMRDAVAMLEAGHVAGALVEAAAAAGLTARARTVPVAAGEPGPAVVVDIGRPTGVTVHPERVLAPRSSGIGAHGRLSGDPRPLDGAVLRQLTAASIAPTGSLTVRWKSRPRHRLVVNGVDGFSDGLYAVRGGAPTLIEAGPVAARLQSAFRFGPEHVDFTSLKAIWVVTADIGGAVRAAGPAAYRDTLLAVGATAQHVCSAAAVNGLFCRPVRSFDEEPTEAAVRADPNEDALYMLLIGRDRAASFCYDLTPTEEEPT